MSEPHPRDAEAAEYALGTLEVQERRALEREALHDRGLAAAIRGWEERLAPLAEELPPVPPSPALRGRIERAIRARPDAEVLPFTVPPEIVRLRRSRNAWRAAMAGASAMAATLAGVLVLQRPAPVASGPELVAVVNRAGDLPALIVRVDQKAGIVQVRSVAAETPPASSLELWSIAPGDAPRSLGVIGSGLTRVTVPAGRARLGPDVTLAVSVEPTGGSPSGSPTGPVVYSGKLLPESP